MRAERVRPPARVVCDSRVHNAQPIRVRARRRLRVRARALHFAARAAGSAPLNSLCTRDFVEPAASGSCLCGEKEFCLCTPSLAADVIELEDSVGTVRHVESSLNARTVGRGLAMVGGFVKVGESRFLLGDTGRR